MKPLPCYRAVHFLPYLEFLRTIGAPVERELCRAKLPTMLSDRPNAYLPELPTLDFLTAMSQSQGIDDLGLRAAAMQPLRVSEFGASIKAAIAQSPTLLAALERYRTLVSIEDTSVHFWMHAEEDQVTLCSSNHVADDYSAALAGSRCDDWSQLGALIALILVFTGPTWHPAEMALRSEAPLSRFASEQFPHTRIRIGQESTSLTVPRSLLSLPSQARPEAAGAWFPSCADSAPPAALPWEFSGSLRRVLTAYLGDGSPSIQLAAQLAGTSVRTLQRQLKKANMTYTDLVQEARFEVASELLRDTDMKIIEIAYEVGYEDPSHFARAFRRLAGISPRHYRRQHQLHEDFVVPNGSSSGMLDTAWVA